MNSTLSLSRVVVVVVVTSASALALARADDGQSKSSGGEQRAADDPLALVALLIQGGDIARARIVLDGVDEEGEGLDRARYARLKGHVLLRQGAYKDAHAALDEAIRLGAPGVDVRRERAQAAYGAGLHEEVLRALDALAWRDDTALVRMRARALSSKGDAAGALATLGEGRARARDLSRPGVRALAIDEVTLLAARDLVVEACDRADSVAPFVDVEEALAILHAVLFTEAGAARDPASRARALATAEGLRARFVLDGRVALVVARAYAEADAPLSGALVLEPFARRDRAHATDVAELYRRAGQRESALQWNAAAEDGPNKLRQRFSILVDARRFEEACALAPRLREKRLTDDPDVAYALAYAQFATGQLDRAQRTARRIDDARRFADVSALVASIDACRKDARLCP